MSLSMTLKPRVSEKAYGLSQTQTTYVFDVPSTANKVTIADAVAMQFKVTVEDVRVVVVKGKKKRSYKKGSRPVIGQRKDVKKAYVRIKSGEKIPIFEAEEVAADKAAKADKKAKKAAPKSSKAKETK